MDDDIAELSSIATSLEELTARIESIASRLINDPDQPAAQEIVEVERALTTAGRRLASAKRMMR